MRKTFLGLALLASGCSLFAGGGSDRPWECSIPDGGVDPCQETAAPGERLRCVIPADQTVGVCGRCEPVDICGNGIDENCDGVVDNGSPETCNDADDDCDGMVDEDLDEDGDGYSWCPTGPPPLDCDDGDPGVRPTRASETPQPDVCDGLDNDCDSATRDGDGECTASQDCDPADDGGTCVEFNCMTRPAICAGDEFCDEDLDPPTCQRLDTTCFNPANQCQGDEVCNPATGTCVMPREDGVPCDYDAECDSALCLPIDALRVLPAHVANRSGVCGRSCCSDDECGGGRCWISGSGARGCVPASLLSTGGGVPVASPCAARSECATECQLFLDDAYEVPSRISLSCGPGYAGRNDCILGLWCVDGVCIGGTCLRTRCSRFSDCPTGICQSGECREACATSENCRDGGACVFFAEPSDAGRDDFYPACSYTSSDSGVGGDACSSDTDCLERTCVDATGAPPSPTSSTLTFCADTCCSDSSCQARDQCRPISVGDHWENHCLPRPMFGRVGTRP